MIGCTQLGATKGTLLPIKSDSLEQKGPTGAFGLSAPPHLVDLLMCNLLGTEYESCRGCFFVKSGGGIVNIAIYFEDDTTVVHLYIWKRFTFTAPICFFAQHMPL